MVVQKRVFHLQRVVVGAVRVFQRVDHTGPEKKAAAAGISVPEPRLDSCECYGILHMIPYGGTEVQGRSTRELESEASHKVNTPVRALSTLHSSSLGPSLAPSVLSSSILATDGTAMALPLLWRDMCIPYSTRNHHRSLNAHGI